MASHPNDVDDDTAWDVGPFGPWNGKVKNVNDVDDDTAWDVGPFGPWNGRVNSVNNVNDVNNKANSNNTNVNTVNNANNKANANKDNKSAVASVNVNNSNANVNNKDNNANVNPLNKMAYDGKQTEGERVVSAIENGVYTEIFALEEPGAVLNESSFKFLESILAEFERVVKEQRKRRAALNNTA